MKVASQVHQVPDWSRYYFYAVNENLYLFRKVNIFKKEK